MPNTPTSTGVIHIDQKEVDQLLKRAAHVTSGEFYSEILKTEISDYFRKRVESRFQSEGDDASGKWIPLSASTQGIRASAGYAPDHPINVRTGEMKNALVSASGDIDEVTTDSATFNWPTSGDFSSRGMQAKLKVAQYGATQSGKYGPTPPRPVIAAGDGDMEAILGILYESITRALSGSGDLASLSVGGLQ